MIGSVISELIGNNDEQTFQSSIVPIIEDCSEKLKEDFGGLDEKR